MICYSIVAKRSVVVTHASMHGAMAVTVVDDAYPKPKLGILATLHEDTFYVQVGDKRVPVSAALALSAATEKLKDGRELRITRASFAINGKGDMELVADNGNDDQVLLLIDVSSGTSGEVTYDCPNGFALVQRGYQNLRAFQGDEEVILAALSRGETITARRLEKKYIWFGRKSVTESMTFTLDPDLHCTLTQAGKTGSERVF